MILAGINSIHSIILGVKDSIDIVEIADKSFLGNYIPGQLRNYGSSDFNYAQDVLNFLDSELDGAKPNSIMDFTRRKYLQIALNDNIIIFNKLRKQC